MKALVTGGAGFIGSNLAEALVRKGFAVTVIDDLSSGKKENLDGIDVRFVKGSILDLELLKKEFSGVDFVFHIAAMPSVPVSLNKPSETNDVNITGTLNVLIAAKEAGVKRVVYSGSSSRYGDSDEKFKHETLTPKPLSPYALQKFTGEEYCRLFYELFGLETVSLIFFNVFGPKQNPESEYAAVIPKFISQMLEGEQPVIYGDGTTSRDFTYVDNNVNACIKAATADVAGKVINVACGKSYTLLELVGKINKILGTSIKPEFEPFRKGDIRHSLADISEARKMGYDVDVDFEKGLRKTVEWLK